MKLRKEELKSFLDEKVARYNNADFIELDPISIPHKFSLKEDIEIAGFLSATIAWGNRTAILKSAHRMMEYIDHAPYDFIMNHTENDLAGIRGVIHRTFNAEDLIFFIRALNHIYSRHKGLEEIFKKYKTETSLQPAIHKLRYLFSELPHNKRVMKHISDPFNGSAAKKINMYLRWMVRKDNQGVDFGIWPSVSPSILSCPLDVHSGNVARKLGLLKRKLNDSKAVTELDASLRDLDETDPVRYDYALFGLGVFEKF